MKHLLYIPTGEYIKFKKENTITIDVDEWKKFKFKGISDEGFLNYLIDLCRYPGYAEFCSRNNILLPVCREEFEIVTI